MSIFKKAPSFDLEEYLLKKYNLVLDRSSPVSLELQKEIELEIEKELKKMSAFLGEFKCKIQDNHIHIPWDIDTLNDRFVWMLIIANRKEKIVFTYADHPLEVGDCSVLQQDSCEFLENGNLLVPKAMLNILNTDECIWIGRAGYAELLSAQDYDVIHTAQDIRTDLFRIE